MGQKRRKGSGTVRQRDDGRWEGRYIVGHTEDGNVAQKSVFGKTRKECLEKLAALKEEVGVRSDKLSPEINVNPANGCRLPPKKAREMQVLTPEELYRFMIQANAEGYYEFFLLELSTGMRRGEILALQWKDLNFETGELNIYKQVNRIKGKLIVSQPKTKSSIRKIVIPAPVVSVLKELHEKTTSKWMFPSPVKANDEPLDPSAIKNRFTLILERANCKHIRFHDLRHPYVKHTTKNMTFQSCALCWASTGRSFEIPM